MNKSETIGKLAEALAKAQGQMRGALKDAANPFFKSKYADLASVWDACREPLSANGLSVVQVPEFGVTGVVVSTVLMHTSGEWISGEIAMQPVKSDPQGIGSAVTYARRYALSAFVGIAPEDDDGNAASGKNASVTQQPVTFKKAAAAPIPVDTPAGPLPEVPSDCIEKGQAVNFERGFREALRKELQKDAKELSHAWLKKQGIVDAIGKPTAEAIKKASFYDVREAAEQYAKTL